MKNASAPPKTKLIVKLTRNVSLQPLTIALAAVGCRGTSGRHRQNPC